MCWSSESRARWTPNIAETLTSARDHRADANRDRAKPRVHHDLPFDLLVHRAGRRDVRDLQRVLHHGGPTTTGERAAARDRREPSSGHVGVADRIGGGRPVRFHCSACSAGSDSPSVSATSSTRSTTAIPARGLALEPFTVAITIIAGTAATPDRRDRSGDRRRSSLAGRGDDRHGLRTDRPDARSTDRRRRMRRAGCGTIVAVLVGADGILLGVGIALLFAACCCSVR